MKMTRLRSISQPFFLLLYFLKFQIKAWPMMNDDVLDYTIDPALVGLLGLVY